jgi:aryl sulfotransferase
MKNLVWLTSYPRSGNTWFRIFLSFLLSGNKKKELNQLEISLIANSRIMFDEIVGIQSSDLKKEEIFDLKHKVFSFLSEEFNQDLYIKTHEKFYYTSTGLPGFPVKNSKSCIYFIRNPLDLTVSNALYFNKPVEKIIEEMMNSEYSLNFSNNCLLPLLEEKLDTWSNHVMSWLNSGIRVHVIRYEDMINEPFKTFSLAIKFLGLKYSDETIIKAIEETSFETLQKMETETGFKEKLQSCDVFFKNGKSGIWRSYLNNSQVKLIIDNHHYVMSKFGYL